jgi:anti-sigma regulatory factor (Ser/Thr protein kinase)
MFANCTPNRNTIDSLQIIMAELLGNCIAHSSKNNDEPFGLVCGQAWPNGNLAQIAIADTGLGIRDSLAGNLELGEQLASQNACELACVYGVTGKPNGNHSGYGLAITQRLAAQKNGVLTVVSGNELYRVDGKNETSREIDSLWNGTLIIFEWNLNVPLDIDSVYASLPRPATMKEEEWDEIFD